MIKYITLFIISIMFLQVTIISAAEELKPSGVPYSYFQYKEEKIIFIGTDEGSDQIYMTLSDNSVWYPLNSKRILSEVILVNDWEIGDWIKIVGAPSFHPSNDGSTGWIIANKYKRWADEGESDSYVAEFILAPLDKWTHIDEDQQLAIQQSIDNSPLGHIDTITNIVNGSEGYEGFADPSYIKIGKHIFEVTNSDMISYVSKFWHEGDEVVVSVPPLWKEYWRFVEPERRSRKFKLANISLYNEQATSTYEIEVHTKQY